MRDVAKEIADSARDPSPDGEGAPFPWSPLHVEGYRDRSGEWHDGLVEICGATPRAISDALTQLGRAGYEMRQPVTDRNGVPVVDKRGRVVYAGRGHALSLWVPPLERRPQPDSSHSGATNDDQPDDESSHEGATNEADRSHPGVSKLAPECDPITSASPNVKTALTAAAPRLAEDQGQIQDQSQSRVGDGVDDEQHPLVVASVLLTPGKLAKPASSPGTEAKSADQAQQFPSPIPESTTDGHHARARLATVSSEPAEPAAPDAISLLSWAIACPHCSAEVGKPCTNSGTKKPTHTHSARTEALQAAS